MARIFTLQESASLIDSIKDIKRGSPFILAIGNKFNIILESQRLFRIETCSEAVLALMAVYYVFNLHYNVHVKPSLLFLQAVCLHLEDDDEVREEEQLAMFRNVLKKLRNGNRSGENSLLARTLHYFIYIFNVYFFILLASAADDGTSDNEDADESNENLVDETPSSEDE